MGDRAVLAEQVLPLSFDYVGALLSIEKRVTGRSYVARPGVSWKLIYSDGYRGECEIVPGPCGPTRGTMGSRSCSGTDRTRAAASMWPKLDRLWRSVRTPSQLPQPEPALATGAIGLTVLSL